MKKHFILLICLLWASVPRAQTQQEGQQWIRQYLSEIRALQAPGAGKVYHLQMTIVQEAAPQTYPASGGGPTQSIDLEIKMSSGKMFYESPQVSLYRDEKDVFTVAHSQKLIVWTKPEKQAASAQDASLQQMLTGLQDQILANAQVVWSRNSKLEGKEVKEIRLETAQEVQKKYNFRYITFFFDLRSKRMLKQVVEFNPGYRLVRQTMLFTRLDVNYKGKMPPTAYGEIFSAQNKLLASKAGYRIEKQW